MTNILTEILNTSIMLFIIIDFLGSVPIFASLLKDMSDKERKKTINLAIIVSFIILLFFSILGFQIFKLFGVSLGEFKIAGGILLLIVSLDEIFGLLPQRGAIKEDLGIVPIASPLLVGPGAITTVIISLQRIEFPSNYVVTLISSIIVLSITWIMFFNINLISKILGRKGSIVLSRIMGIIIMAISVNYILSGFKK